MGVRALVEGVVEVEEDGEGVHCLAGEVVLRDFAFLIFFPFFLFKRRGMGKEK